MTSVVDSLHNEPRREGLGGARESRKAARLPQTRQRPSPALGQAVLTAAEGSLRVQREERKGGRHSPTLAHVGAGGERRAGEGEEEAQGSGCHRPECERDRRTRAAQRLKVERSDLELEGSVLEARCEPRKAERRRPERRRHVKEGAEALPGLGRPAPRMRPRLPRAL
ncbi:MAG TPA: hypothetical protein VE078_04725 [Thermoanaerobaculia bacterium]|nr:hypothetical protein [Thermoanaerobaculia bacterium]